MFDFIGLVDLVLRAAGVLWALPVTVLNALLISAAADIDEPAAHTTLNFGMFVVMLSWVAIIYGLASRFNPDLRHPLVIAILDGLVTLLSFSSGVITAYRLGVLDCRQFSDITELESMCRVAQADVAFMWFLFATFTATTFLAIMDYRDRSARRGFRVF